MPVTTASPPPLSKAAEQRTLVLDIGGTGLKATVLDARGRPEHERVRVDTTYPCPPDKLVADLVKLVTPLPPYQRVSAGFPGVVRGGRVLTAPHFVTRHGPGSRVDAELAKKWRNFDLAGALGAPLGAPVRVANDADVQPPRPCRTWTSTEAASGGAAPDPGCAPSQSRVPTRKIPMTLTVAPPSPVNGPSARCWTSSPPARAALGRDRVPGEATKWMPASTPEPSRLAAVTPGTHLDTEQPPCSASRSSVHRSGAGPGGTL